jgi:uncharacterized protein (DUF885 family)
MGLLGLINCHPGETAETQAQSQFAQFLEAYNDTAGNETEDVSVNMSRADFDAELSKIKDQLRALRAIDPALLSGDDRIDWKFAESILRGRELRLENMEPWKKNPRMYMTFTNISTLIDGPGSTADKVTEIQKRLKRVPVQLENGARQIDVYIPRFQELSVFMAENGRVLFNKELPAFITKSGDEAAPLQPLTDQARTALEK